MQWQQYNKGRLFNLKPITCQLVAPCHSCQLAQAQASHKKFILFFSWGGFAPPDPPFKSAAVAASTSQIGPLKPSRRLSQPPEFRGSGGRSPPGFRGSGGRSPPGCGGSRGRQPPGMRGVRWRQPPGGSSLIQPGGLFLVGLFTTLCQSLLRL